MEDSIRNPIRSPSRTSRIQGRRPLPTYFIWLIAGLVVTVFVTTITQLRIVSFDSDAGVSIDFKSLSYNLLPNEVDDDYVKSFSTQPGNENANNDDDQDDDIDNKDRENNDDGNNEENGSESDHTDNEDTERNDIDNDNDDDDDENNEENKNNDQNIDPEIAKSFPKISDQERLNVLLLYPDDWRHDSLGSEKPYVLTPFLDQLAKEGIRFTHNAVTTSVCWMSRATLWMGQYSSRHKSYKLLCPRFGSRENWNHSWIKLLQNTGYYIGHVGKWQYYTKKTKKYFNWSYLFEGHHWEKIYGGTVLHAADLAKMKALEFLDKRPKDKPFVLSVAFYPPKPVGSGRAPGHQWSPTNETKKLYENVTIPRPEHEESFQKLPEFLKRGAAVGRFGQRYPTEEHFQASMRNYYALVTGVDQACKGIVEKLKAEGLYNNTMIIFTTDNGMFHGSHGLAGKWYPYQESIRVPLIIYDPRMPAHKVGKLDDSFTLNVDLAETIMGAARVKPDDLMQGRDISDLYMPNNHKNEYHNSASVDTEPWRDEFFYEFPSPDEAYIPSSTALVRKRWKYIYWPKHNREQLFNLKKDPLEMLDLYDKPDEQETLSEMRRRHDELKKELHDESYVNDTNACRQFQYDLNAGLV